MIPKINIIIADNNQEDRELLKFLFNASKSFELIGSFDNGLDVIEEILTKKNVPDVLLINRDMPFISGIDILEKLEQSVSVSSMYKFIISTTINPSDKKKNLDNPSINFVKKPVTLVEINDLPGIILDTLNLSNHLKI